MTKIFRGGEMPPSWCELIAFRIVNLGRDGEEHFERQSPRERVMSTAGTIQIAFGGQSQVLKEGQFLDLPQSVKGYHMTGHSEPSQGVVLSGRWGDEMGGCGIFRVGNETSPRDQGDPVAYAKQTAVDSHYHDCDEFWLLLEGRARVVVGGVFAEMRPGDCLAIGMGHHHDMPAAPEAVKAVFFETTIQGRKRVGHLWEHTHGPAEPQEDRI